MCPAWPSLFVSCWGHPMALARFFTDRPKYWTDKASPSFLPAFTGCLSASGRFPVGQFARLPPTGPSSNSISKIHVGAVVFLTSIPPSSARQFELSALER